MTALREPIPDAKNATARRWRRIPLFPWPKARCAGSADIGGGG
jgi:hypothetical protein